MSTVGRDEVLGIALYFRDYHQYLLGPSVQQVLMKATAPENLTWIEERVEGGT